jgi:plastocyanin
MRLRRVPAPILSHGTPRRGSSRTRENPSHALLVILSLGGAALSQAADMRIEVRSLQGDPLSDAVVFAEPSLGAAPAPTGGSRATIDQVDKQFVPRISVMRAGTEVHFPNSDNIRHSVYSFSPAKVFATKLYAGRQAAPVTFENAGVIVLGCNIHDTMLAWAVVVDTPWYGKTATDGSITLEGLAPGMYRVSGWFPGLTEPVVQQVELTAQGATPGVLRLDSSRSPLKRGTP